MATRTFLAMTGAEIFGNQQFPAHIAWMACHFSPYGTGLSNQPKKLPAGSLLILNDRIPIHGHDPELIAMQLEQTVQFLGCSGLLLDFQRPDCSETAALTKRLISCLSCPVAVSQAYVQGTECPVFLPPLPHHISLSEYIALWQEREIWLELALDGEVITLTENGSAITPLYPSDVPEKGQIEDALHCHYHVTLKDNAAEFTLWRTREDLTSLLEEAQQLGIFTSVGLFQEFFKQ